MDANEIVKSKCCEILNGKIKVMALWRSTSKVDAELIGACKNALIAAGIDPRKLGAR